MPFGITVNDPRTLAAVAALARQVHILQGTVDVIALEVNGLAQSNVTLSGKIETLMATSNTATSVLQSVEAAVSSNTGLLTALTSGLTSLQTTDQTALKDLQALVSSLQSGGTAAQADIDAAATAITQLTTNNAALGSLATLVSQMSASSLAADPNKPVTTGTGTTGTGTTTAPAA